MHDWALIAQVQHLRESLGDISTVQPSNAAIIMCTIGEGRPSCSCTRHLLHQDWFYSVSSEPLMTLNDDALRNELNQRYNTATRKTLAFIWPRCGCLCERERLLNHSSTSHVLIWTVMTPDHKDALWMFYVVLVHGDSCCRWTVLSAPRHKTELQTSLRSTLLHMLWIWACQIDKCFIS